jgi:Fur family ferric uptake transcriptional regulator
MEARKLLKSYRLSLTKSRLMLLEVLENSALPLSERDIEEEMGRACDRTTIYRNLGTLVEKGLVQRILSDNSVKYKLLCDSGREKKMHDHVHFQCRICNRVVCLEDLKVRDYDLPKGYLKIENQFLIVGICKDCNHVA